MNVRTNHQVSGVAFSQRTIGAATIVLAIVGASMAVRQPVWVAIGAIALLACTLYLVVPARFRTRAFVFLAPCVFVDSFASVDLGPITLHGLITTCIFGLALLALPGALATSAIVNVSDVVGMFFVAWTAFATYAAGGFAISALQNLLVLSLWFLVPVAIASDMFERRLQREDLDLAFILLAFGSSMLFAANRLLPFMPSFLSPGNRSFGLFAVACLCWLSPLYWRARSGIVLIANASLLLLTALSLSRTAMVLAVGILALSRLRGRSLRSLSSTFVLTSLAFLALGMAVIRVPALKDRFLGGDRGFELFGIRFDAAGRAELWSRTWNSFTESSLSATIGNGAGASQEFVQSEFGTIAHPHNDYLRLLYDFGVLGLMLWLIPTIIVGLNAFRAFQLARSRDQDAERVHLSAVLAIGSLLVGMVTDNVIIYVFVVVPLAVIVGFSRGQQVPVEAQVLNSDTQGPHLTS